MYQIFAFEHSSFRGHFCEALATKDLPVVVEYFRCLLETGCGQDDVLFAAFLHYLLALIFNAVSDLTC